MANKLKARTLNPRCRYIAKYGEQVQEVSENANWVVFGDSGQGRIHLTPSTLDTHVQVLVVSEEDLAYLIEAALES